MAEFISRNKQSWLLQMMVTMCMALVLIDLQKYAHATECFPRSESLLPKVNKYVGEPVTGYIESFDAVVGTDDFIIYGGRQYGPKMSTLDKNELSILTRMDLSKNTRRWTKTFDIDF